VRISNALLNVLAILYVVFFYREVRFLHHGLVKTATNLLLFTAAAKFGREWQNGRDKLSPQLRALMERGREVRAVDYQRALRLVPRLAESFDELFMERYDAILTPAALGTAPKGLGATGDPVFCSLWTLLGMPAISLPLMQGATGLPLGVQLVGRRNFDAVLLRTARWLAARVG
jgi:Asp-tRNA(Asn)/Glu-tRNA(Gln) amidotransferase A subunit family amidase